MNRDYRVYKPGDLIFREGDPSGGLYFIESGKVDVFRSRDGTDVVLGTLGAGEILGTLTVFSGEARTASARATTKVEAQYMSSASLTSGMSKIPVWAVAIIKDTIARLKFVDELLVQSTVNEKKLKAENGSIFHHGAQLAHFCALMIRLQSKEDEGILIWPTNALTARAESILNLRAEYLDGLWKAFVSGGLAKPIDDKKWGPVLRNPQAKVFEDFGVFAAKVAKRGTGDFLQQKMVRLAGSLVRVRQKHRALSTLPRDLFISSLAKDSGRDLPPGLMEHLQEKGLIRIVNDEVSYEAEPIVRRLVFEATCQALLDEDGTEAVRPGTKPSGVKPVQAA